MKGIYDYNMKRKYKIGILGATGMVGQRFVTLLRQHPWFTIEVLAASTQSAGKTYGEAVDGRWVMDEGIPEEFKNKVVLDAVKDIDIITNKVDFVFCAVNMNKEEIKKFEEMYAIKECPVVSNNSAHRFTNDVPMIIPEINSEHIEIIPYQRKRLGTNRGFIAVKSNCSLQCYVPPLYPLKDFGIKNVLVCTYQAVSGAGKTLKSWPQINDNIIPYIAGEEEKSEKEPLKIWGSIKGDAIQLADRPNITAQCIRVPVSDGHTAAVFVDFDKKVSVDQIIDRWQNYVVNSNVSDLPSSPKKFINYFNEKDRPQVKLDKMLENGMAINVGRLREDTQYDVKFVCMAHNTIRGAAGGAILLAELLCSKGYI